MIGRHASRFALCLALSAAPALAEPAKPVPPAAPAAKPPAPVAPSAPVTIEEPRDIVVAIYRLAASDLKKADSASPFFDHATRKAYFSKGFDLLVTSAESAAARDKSALIDFDPITASQDPAIQKIVVKTDLLDLAKATASASFVNRGQATVVTYDFVKQDGAWKIDDIKGTTEKEAWSVRKILKETGSPPKALPGQKDAGKAPPDASVPVKAVPEKGAADKAPPAEKPAPKPH